MMQSTAQVRSGAREVEAVHRKSNASTLRVRTMGQPMGLWIASRGNRHRSPLGNGPHHNSTFAMGNSSKELPQYKRNTVRPATADQTRHRTKVVAQDASQ